MGGANNHSIQNLPSTFENPEPALELSLGAIYTGNPSVNPLARSSTVAGVSTREYPRMQLPQSVNPLARSSTVPRVLTRAEPRMPPPQMAALVAPAVRLPSVEQAASTYRRKKPEPRMKRPIRPQNILAVKRLETKQRLADKQRSQQRAVSLPEKTNTPAATPKSQPSQLTARTISSAPDRTGTSSTAFKVKTEECVSVTPAHNGNVPLGFPTLEVKPVIRSPGAENARENPSKRLKKSQGTVWHEREKRLRMPSVRTIGANGRLTEGVLYRYRKGQVLILCVCHGQIHSPASFIKHAGGIEVADPLRHIIIAPPPSDDDD